MHTFLEGGDLMYTQRITSAPLIAFRFGKQATDQGAWGFFSPCTTTSGEHSFV